MDPESDYLRGLTAENVYNVSRCLYGPFVADLFRVVAVILDFATLGENEAPFPSEISTDNFCRIREILVIECGFELKEVGGSGQWVIRWGHVGVTR